MAHTHAFRTISRILSIKPLISFTKKRASMSSQATGSSGGLHLQDVVNRLESYAPTSLAESWDNVGLLLEPSSPHFVRRIFLTNDLTEDVLEEAKEKSADLVLSYHPPIFSSIKRITQDAWKNRIIVKAIENRIAIYSPHTSYDAVNGGVNDWLISCFQGSVTPITPSAGDDSGNGMGRICKLDAPQHIDTVIQTVKTHLGLSHVRVAFPSPRQEQIGSIASCAGSGASLLRDIDADLYLTGEMSHHECLDAVAKKRTVVLCEHSNTERGFLKATLKPTLWKIMEEKVEIVVSCLDKDPLVVV